MSEWKIYQLDNGDLINTAIIFAMIVMALYAYTAYILFV